MKKISKEETIAAIKNSAITPPDSSFDSIMAKVKSAENVGVFTAPRTNRVNYYPRVFRYAGVAVCAMLLVFGFWAIPSLLNNPGVNIGGSNNVSSIGENGSAITHNGNGTPDPGYIANLPPEYQQNTETENNEQYYTPPIITLYALTFNDEPDSGVGASGRVMWDFTHELTDEQFNAIFPLLERSRFETSVSYSLPRNNFAGRAEVTAHEIDGQATILLAEGVITFINPLAPVEELQVSYVHGTAVTATVRETNAVYHVRAEFVLEEIGYNIHYSDADQEIAKARLTELVNAIIYGGAADWSVLADPIVPELRNESLTLEQARLDSDFGVYMPINIPQGFVFDSARRTLNQRENNLRANWHRFPTFDNISWTVAEQREHQLERIVSASDRHKFDVSLYPIPWADSVPREVRDYFHNPVFRAEEITLEVVQARARWVDDDQGDTPGWRISNFSVLYESGVIITISARGASPEEIWAMLP